MSKFKDLSGQRFGRLTVLKLDCRKNNRTYWNCVCDCGNVCSVRQDNLVRKKEPTRSCGCLLKEQSKKRLVEITTTHGMTKSRFYKIWDCIKQRCNNPNDNKYNDYGGRGIIVEWKSFEEFKNDMYDSYIEHVNQFGEENTTIDRIDVNGNYCKDNCRWATWKEQQRNKRNTRMLEYNGKNQSISDWAEELGISAKTISSRICRGEKDPARILRKPSGFGTVDDE